MTKTKSKKLPFITWDELDIIECQKEFLLEQAKEAGEELTEEEAFQQASEDSDLFSIEWDNLCDQLTEEMTARNPSGHWRATVKGFGWQGLDGWKEFEAKDGKTFLSEILPQTDCTFKIYKHGRKGFSINNAHHDAPTWGEWYYIEPSKEEVD